MPFAGSATTLTLNSYKITDIRADSAHMPNTLYTVWRVCVCGVSVCMQGTPNRVIELKRAAHTHAAMHANALATRSHAHTHTTN